MTPHVGVSLNGRALIDSLGRSAALFDSLLAQALRRTVELASAYAKQSVLFRSHTYGLRSSITGLVVGGFGGVAGAGGGPMGRIMASAPYAKFVEDGTAPHIILPRRKKWLRFEQNGQIRFSRGVFHPGTEPRPFMAEAAARATPILQREVQQAFVRAFE